MNVRNAPLILISVAILLSIIAFVSGQEYFNNWYGIVLFSGLVVIELALIYKKLKSARQIFFEFVIPIFLVLYIFTIGWAAFSSNSNRDLFYPFFETTKLITLDNITDKSKDQKSALNPGLLPNEVEKDSKGDQINIFFLTVRWVIILLLAWAFFIALMKAIGIENKNRILFWLHRNKIGDNSFKVVIGDSGDSIGIALGLRRAGSKVFYLGEDISDNNENILKENRIWYIKGNTTLSQDINKTSFHKADEIYLSKVNDEENIRTYVEIIEKFQKVESSRTSPTEIFIDISNKRLNDLASSIYLNFQKNRFIDGDFSESKNNQNHVLNIYNIHQQLIRRTLLESNFYNVDAHTDFFQFLIFGFNLHSKILLEYILNVAHFVRKKSTVTVFYNENEKQEVDEFKKTYSTLIEEEDPIWEYTFNIKLEFIEINPDGLRLDLPAHIIEKRRSMDLIFFTGNNGIKSAAAVKRLIKNLIPQLNYEKEKIKIFLRYPHSDIGDFQFLNKFYNNLYKPIEITLYGNLIKYFTHSSNSDNESIIKNHANLGIAKLIHLYYTIKFASGNHEYKKELLEIKDIDIVDSYFNDSNQNNSFSRIKVKKLANKIWSKLEEDAKISNLIAADHSYVKFNEAQKLERQNHTPQEIEDLLAEAEHRRWCADRLLLGFKHGIVKDTNRRIHPNLVPYNDLDESVKRIDIDIVNFLLKLHNTINKYS